jgi:ABC-2 type transport system ATP-binding protein
VNLTSVPPPIPVLHAEGLGRRYGRRWALRDCSFEIPAGRVVALVGPNGAGKTTLLHLAVGLLRATTGSIEVLGEVPAAGPEQLARVGFVAQDTPTYAGLSVADHLRMGAWLNPRWDRRWPNGASSSCTWTRPSGPGSSRAGSARSSP